jgi:hypothetical protein
MLFARFPIDGAFLGAWLHLIVFVPDARSINSHVCNVFRELFDA